MSKISTFVVVGLGAGLLQAFAWTSVADARIVCRDGFQVSAGRSISTPYCNDALVARVAREHGLRVSDNEVRNTPSTRNEICLWVGDDIRIAPYCPYNEVGSAAR